MLDVPNERSSHSSATPSGGGIALMIALLLGVSVAAWGAVDWRADLLGLAAIAGALAILGLVDDLRGVSIQARLLWYALASLLASWLLLSPLLAGEEIAAVSAPGLVAMAAVAVVALAILWLLNLYNFMDGIDGIAALQAILACLAAALLSWGQGGSTGYALFCLLLAAAHAGFLIWNVPPARLFMGDAGSVPTGFLLAGLAVAGWRQGVLDPLCWLVLLAAFITDATWTLLRRMTGGEPFTQPHRSHAYQRLSRHWRSHLKVDLLLLAINLLWLLPLACAIQLWPENAPILVILAYVPLCCGMAKVGGMT
jgi:Fuc2NAc and GlcNAc transferase